MTIIEWMAAIIAIVALIKLIVILIKPSVWMNSVVKPIYSKPMILMVVGLILAGGSLYYLLDSGITIVQIFAVTFFVMALMMVSVAVYSKEIMSLGVRMLKNKQFLKKAWLAIIVWLVLAVWVLQQLFF